MDAELIVQEGVGRWTKYALAGLPARKHKDQSDEERILQYVLEQGSIGNAECRKLLGANMKRASYLLGRLARLGRLRAEGEGRWRRYLPV